MYNKIPEKIKQEVINKIRSDGMSVRTASESFGVSTKAIYKWLHDGISPSSVSLLEHNRIKRENAELYEILGRLMLEKKKGKKEMAKTVKKITKKEMAKRLGVSRSSLYYKSKRESIDLEVKSQIESVLSQNPYYGHKRVAMALKLNKKRIRRVMKKYGLKPLGRKAKFCKKADIGKPPMGFKNLIELFCPIRPNVVWVCDFTYIKFQGRFIYFAVVIDMYTREVVGFSISRFHNKSLVVDAFLAAIKTAGVRAIYIHSDQGSEYASQLYALLAKEFGVEISMSRKGSPWENGFVESFFGKFKTELGDLAQFEELVYLIEKIYHQVWYYNNQRIHTKLKMSPSEFKRSRDYVS